MTCYAGGWFVRLSGLQFPHYSLHGVWMMQTAERSKIVLLGYSVISSAIVEQSVFATPLSTRSWIQGSGFEQPALGSGFKVSDCSRASYSCASLSLSLSRAIVFFFYCVLSLEVYVICMLVHCDAQEHCKGQGTFWKLAVLRTPSNHRVCARSAWRSITAT